MRTRAIAAVLATAAVAIVPVAAQADTLAFIKDNNVWLSNPDGSGQYQTTLDGTADAPYETPSLANDGTVVAVRQTPGQRRQIYRMTQSGGLLNAPINTPAPGTGAIDAKVSPDGQLVAYWFVTTVNDPICTFCVNEANRVLLSHSDRFTNADEVGTPNTGGWPSWITGDTITLGSGSATQWYYKLGMPEAAEWFTSTDIAPDIRTLLDAEAAPSGDRLAVVYGDNQENLLVVKMNGAPPNKPTVANPACEAFGGPNGKFVDPTWAADGRMLAWQENDGVWTLAVPADLSDCAGFGQPALRIAGAKNPDFGSGALNPGARPACGNPGNPSACSTPGPGPAPGPGPTPGPGPGPTPGPTDTLLSTLTSVATKGATTIRRLGIRGLLRKRQFTITLTLPEPGTLDIKLTTKGGVAKAAKLTLLARAHKTFATAGRVSVKLKLTRQGVKLLRRAKRLTASLVVTFTPRGKAAVRVARSVKLKR